MSKTQIIWEVLKAAALGALTGGATIEEIRGTEDRPPARRKAEEGGERKRPSSRGYSS